MSEGNTNKVFIGNLSFDTDTRSLEDFFAQCGTITDAIVISRDGRSRGFGFVTYDNNESAIKAVALGGSDLDGRDIRVEYAAPKRDGGDRGGRGGDRGGRGGDRGGYRDKPYDSGRGGGGGSDRRRFDDRRRSRSRSRSRSPR